MEQNPGVSPFSLLQPFTTSAVALNRISSSFRFVAKQKPQFGRRREYNVMVRNVHKPFLRFFNPVISGDFSARVAEAAFAGMGDVALCSALFAFIQSVSQFVLVSAGEHFLHIFFYTIADIVYA